MVTEFSAIFKNDLKGKLNLLLGAGFSVYARSDSGGAIPLGSQLRDEIALNFDVPNAQKNLPLPRLCSIILATPRAKELRDFLTARFRVSNYDERYDLVRKLELNTIISTNIDDLLYCIFENDTRYIHDAIESGPDLNSKSAIQYLPIHGNVRHPERKYIFSSMEIAGAYSRDTPSHESLRYNLRGCPTVIVGYSMEDAGVLSMFEGGSKTGPMEAHPNRWIFCHNPQEGELDYWRSIGLEPIVGSTELFFNAIENTPKTIVRNNETEGRVVEGIPSAAKVTAQSIDSYFLGGAPKWYDVFYNRLAKTEHFQTLLENCLSGQSTIALGVNYSGKTTVLMQLAAELVKVTDSHILFADYISAGQAKKFASTNDETIILLDNFCSSIDAFNLLMTNSKITVIAADRDFNYDTGFQAIRSGNASIIDISSLSENDMASIFSTIPKSIRRNNFRIPKLNNNEKPFAQEFVEANVVSQSHLNWEARLLRELTDIEPELAELLIMNCFVHNCRGGVSDELVCSYFADYSAAPFKKLERLKGLVSEKVHFDEYVRSDAVDFYIPRSNYFSDKIVKICDDETLAIVFKKLFQNVRSERMPRYSNFRKSAYQVYYTRRVFKDWREGMQFYEALFAQYGNYYDLQHASLYLSHVGKNKEAFYYVEKALDLSGHKVLSIRNTHARILFQANIANSYTDGDARQAVFDSMDILRTCLNSDNRTRNHAILFAEQTVEIHNKLGAGFSDPYYLQAKDALKAETEKGQMTRRISYINRQLQRINYDHPK